MNRDVIYVAGIIAAFVSVAGLISAGSSAHMFDGPNYQSESAEPGLGGQYREMLELHGQYLNDEISFEEFEQKMFSEEFHEEDFGCHGGFGMMGPHMMGWR